MANLNFEPTRQAINDVFDVIENDRISQREALRPSRWADVVSNDKIERWGNIGRDFNYPDGYYLNASGDVVRTNGYNNDLNLIGTSKNVPILYEASAHPSGLPIKAYEQVYRELGPEGIANKASGGPPMRDGPYGRVVRPTGFNGIQVVNSKQDPAYYEALANQQRNIQRYYEMTFDKMRGRSVDPIGISEQMDKRTLERLLTPESLGINAPKDLEEAFNLARIADAERRRFELLGGDVGKQYDRQLLLQAMIKTGRLDNTLIPELHDKVLEAISGNYGQDIRNDFYPHGRRFIPSAYDFSLEGDTPDHAVSIVPKDYHATGDLPFGQDISPALSAMYQYNQQVNKEHLLGLRPPVDSRTGRINKGGHAGFVSTDLLTAPYKPFFNVAKGIAEEDQFLTMVQKGLSNPATARNFATNYLNNPALRSTFNAGMTGSAINTVGKLGAGVAVATTPYMAVNRRDRLLYDWATNNRGYPNNLELLGIMGQAGIENAVNGATFGFYDHYMHPEWEEPMEPVQRGYYSDNGQRVPNWLEGQKSVLLEEPKTGGIPFSRYLR